MAITTTHIKALLIRLPIPLHKDTQKVNPPHNKYNLFFLQKKTKKKETKQKNSNSKQLLVLVSFIIEHSKRNNEENKHRIHNIDSKP